MHGSNRYANDSPAVPAQRKPSATFFTTSVDENKAALFHFKGMELSEVNLEEKTWMYSGGSTPLTDSPFLRLERLWLRELEHDRTLILVFLRPGLGSNCCNLISEKNSMYYLYPGESQMHLTPAFSKENALLVSATALFWLVNMKERAWWMWSQRVCISTETNCPFFDHDTLFFFPFRVPQPDIRKMIATVCLQSISSCLPFWFGCISLRCKFVYPHFISTSTETKYVKETAYEAQHTKRNWMKVLCGSIDCQYLFWVYI